MIWAMSDSPNPQPSGMFSEPVQERRFASTTTLLVSVGVVVLVLALLILPALRKSHTATAANTPLPVAAYASQLSLGEIQMSESSSPLAGGRLVYVDGKIANHGTATVTGIQVQVLFANDEKMPAQVVTLPLMLIRTHEPYVDTEPVSAEPLTPGAEKEFRLIVENIGTNWNQALPEIHVTSVQTR